MNQIKALYSRLFDPQKPISESPKETLDTLHFPVEELRYAVETLAGRSYDGMDIIESSDGKILEVRQEVLTRINQKRTSGELLSHIEQLVLCVGAYLMSDLPLRFERDIAEKVDFPSRSNENSFEKTDKNVRRLKVLSESMSGILGLQAGAEVPMRLMPEGTHYKKGDIIVFYRDEIKIVHQIEYVHESNGETFYITTGVNTETNQYVDSDLVSQNDVIRIVDLSKEAYLELNEMMARRYVAFITAFGMTLESAKILEDFFREKSTYLRNALKNAKDEATSRGLKLVSPNDPNKELSFEEFTLACIESYNGKNKFYGDAILTWKHEDCGHVWENTYNNIKRNVGNCPKCDGQYINQKITNEICEYIFKELGYIENNYQIEYGLTKIFPELEGLIHANVHVDGYVELNIEDKNGNLIKLAIEYQGQQHDPDPKIGFEAYKAVSKQLDVVEGTKKYSKVYKPWRDLITRDEDKVDHFEKNNKDGYYLIVVDYNVDPEDRLDFIISKFEELTKITLSKIPYRDWRTF
ncbi:MAG: hypothetical protein BAJALOKI3v1_660021 [Promethearchaeota archaeon]|nr:MAG: hypothetical protein BAJALOKI3v1_660021 [Candidatus Lokiarchaeota archaeon]